MRDLQKEDPSSDKRKSRVHEVTRQRILLFYSIVRFLQVDISNYFYKNNVMTREQAAKELVEKTFHSLCFEKSSFTSEDVRRVCLELIDREMERTEFVTEIIGE